MYRHMDKILRYRIKELTNLPMRFFYISLLYIYHGYHMAKIFQFSISTRITNKYQAHDHINKFIGL